MKLVYVRRLVSFLVILPEMLILFISLAQLFPAQSHALELDIKLNSLQYGIDLNADLHTDLHTDLRLTEQSAQSVVGRFSAQKFKFMSPTMNFVLKPNYKFEGEILRRGDWLILDDKTFQFAYSIHDLPFFQNIHFLYFDDFRFYSSNQTLNLLGKKGEFAFKDTHLVMENLNYVCGMRKNLIDGQEEVLESCLNSSALSRFDKSKKSTRVGFRSGRFVGQFWVDNLSLTENKLGMGVDQFSVSDGENSVESEKISLSCSKNHYTKNFNDKLAVATCLKNAVVKAPQVSFKASEKNIRGKMEIEKLLANGRHMLFVAPSGSIAHKNQQMEFKHLQAYCDLPDLTENFRYEHLVQSCMNTSAIKLNEFHSVDPEGHLKIQGASFGVQPETIGFKIPKLDVLHLGDSFTMSKVRYSCKNLSSKDRGSADQGVGFDFGQMGQDVVEGCFQESSGQMEDFAFESDKNRVSLNILKLDVTQNKLELASPKIAYQDLTGPLQINLMNPKIECVRENTQDMTLENILRGCFDSSKLEIPSIEVKHSKIEGQILVNHISVDRHQLQLNSPEGKYAMNGFDNYYNDLKVHCRLNASYDLAKNHDWETILENCLHSSQISLESLSSVYSGENAFLKFGNAIKSIGIKGINKVYFTSSGQVNNLFKLNITPKILSFIPVEVTIFGYISYSRFDKNIVMDVKNTFFYNLIPAKLLVQLLLNAFVQNDFIDIQGNRIIIALPNDMANENE